MLRPFLALVAVATMVAAHPSSVAAQQKHGDVSGEGTISALDAQAILTFVVGLPLPAGYMPGNGVSVCDGRTAPGALDAQVVLKFAIGLDVSSTCVGQLFGPGATAIVLTPLDSSVLMTRTRVFKAQLKQADGSLIKRPISWSTSAPAVAAIDSIKGDSIAFVRGVAAGSSTITATSDGVSLGTPLKVVTSYAGIVITPQRMDTVRQVGAQLNYFYAVNRDSLGSVSGNPAGFWTSTDTTKLVVTYPAEGTASYYAQAETRGQGTAYLKLRAQSNPALLDSIAITTALPTVAACTSGTGTMHSSVTYTTPQTWTVATQPHFVSGQVSFNSGANLTIQPGTLVCFNGGSLVFKAGSRLMAQGKPDSIIKFVAATEGSYWGDIQLGDNSSYGTGAPADTSRISNALIENAYNGIYGYNQHAVIIDSVRVRNFYYNGVQILAPGSRLSRSVVDTSLYGYNGYAITLGRALVENTSVHLTSTGTGVFLTDTGTVRNVDIQGGTSGIADYYYYYYYAANGARLNNVTIQGTSGTALQLEYSTVAATSANVSITGSTGGAYRGQIGNLGILFPDSASQDMLKNNGKDTVFVTGGYLVRDTAVVRPDLPWVITNVTYVDSLALLKVLAGSTVNVDYWGIQFQKGGTLSAVGTPTKFIRFRPTGSSTFYGLRFDSPGAGGIPANAPTAVSTLSYVQVDSAYGQGTNDGIGYSAAIAGGVRHRLLMDSVIIRKPYYTAASIAAKGSYLMRSVIDTTGPASSNFVSSQPALVLGDSVLVDSTLVRRSGQIGIFAQGTGVNLRYVRVVASQAQAISAENGLLAATTTSVRADSANAFPFYGRIENLALIARDSATQVDNFARNTDSLIVITGGTLTRDTVAIVPQRRWRIDNATYVDTLAQIKARPGARIDVAYWGLQFQKGGTLSAIGSPTNFVVFRSTGTSTFYGLRFDSPGAGTVPALAPTAVSTLTYVRIDSAYGQGNNDGVGYSAAVSAGARHRILADSVIVRYASYAAFSLAAKNSSINRSRVDTTGFASSNFTSSQPAIVVGDSVTVQNTLVRRSGNAGILTAGQGVQLINVRVVASLDRALSLETGILDPRTTNVRADSANAYPFYGRIENLARVANDSLSQLNNFANNVAGTIIVTGGSLTNDTLVAIRERPWRVDGPTYIDTLAQLRPKPGATFNVYYWGFQFRQGGTLLALGSSTDSIKFRSIANGSTFYGLRFDSPGDGGVPANAPTAVSSMMYVRVDSAYGHGNDGIGYTAAIAGGARHRLQIDSSNIRKSFYGAVTLSAPGSYVSGTTIDTTGFASSNFTTSNPAVVLNDSTSLVNSLVRRSGQIGVLVDGDNISISNTIIERSLSYGLYVYNNSATTGSAGLSLSGFEIRNGSIGGVAIEANSVTLSFCKVHDNGTTTSHHGFTTTNNYSGVSISQCDITNNAGFGVNNFALSNASYMITANNDYWGDPQGVTGPSSDGISANVNADISCLTSCSAPAFSPMGQGAPSSPAVPVTEYVWQRSRRTRRRKRKS